MHAEGNQPVGTRHARQERRGVALQLPHGPCQRAGEAGQGRQLHRFEPQGNQVMALSQRRGLQEEDQGKERRRYSHVERQAHAFDGPAGHFVDLEGYCVARIDLYGRAVAPAHCSGKTSRLMVWWANLSPFAFSSLILFAVWQKSCSRRFAAGLGVR